MYHGFTEKNIHTGIENYGDKHINSKTFSDQIKYLKNHYNILSLNELVQHYKKRTNIPKNSVVITMDDGYRSNWTIAYPILRKFNVPATIFITTDFVDKAKHLWVDRLEYAIEKSLSDKIVLRIADNTFEYSLQDTQSKIEACKDIKQRLKVLEEDDKEKFLIKIEKIIGREFIKVNAPSIYQPLRWKEISKMSANGLILIGSHTCSHAILSRCTRVKLNDEIVLSKKVLEEKTGKKCDHFCYPNGEKGDFDEITKDCLRKAGFFSALTTITGMNDDSSDVFELKRLYIRNGISHTEFIMTLSGVIRVFEMTKKISLRIFYKYRK
jgi:peptidoglycan/xylan/chitin deacetylase (PgdA/CDA1 family)